MATWTLVRMPQGKDSWWKVFLARTPSGVTLQLDHLDAEAKGLAVGIGARILLGLEREDQRGAVGGDAHRPLLAADKLNTVKLRLNHLTLLSPHARNLIDNV